MMTTWKLTPSALLVTTSGSMIQSELEKDAKLWQTAR